MDTNEILYKLAANIVEHTDAMPPDGGGHLAKDRRIEVVQDILRQTLNAERFVRIVTFNEPKS
jgi:hypothetical protein